MTILSIPLVLLLLLSTTYVGADGDVKTIKTTEELERALSTLPRCPDFPTKAVPVQHRDTACNRVKMNDPKKRAHRKGLHNFMTGAQAMRIPEQKTWLCPTDDVIGYVDEAQGAQIGVPETWIVRNAASIPIVLSYLDAKRNYQEFSPMNVNIKTPEDPKAILQPGQWTAISVFQGHLFTARELIPTENGQMGLGRVLLRHRPGLVPIMNRLGVPLDCSAPEIRADPEPKPEQPVIVESRTPENLMEMCNVQHKGFINRVGCPVDVYWAGGTAASLPEVSSNKTDVEGDTEKISYRPTCSERFKFHLGINPNPGDYLDDWNSPIAYEGTYLMHRFVARLRHDPNVVVDEVVMEESLVRDCPVRKSKAKVHSKLMDKVLQNVEVQVGSKMTIDLSDLKKHTVWSGNGTAISLGQLASQ